MSTHLVKQSRTIFLDTDTLTNAVSSKAKVNFPPMFSTCCDDRMRLTLQQIVIPRRFHTVNVTNQFFYVRDPTGDTYIEVEIPSGDYSTIAELATAVQVGLRSANATLDDATCSVSGNSRRLVITMPKVHATAFIVCFQSRGTKPSASVSNTGFFQQTHIILGCKPSRGDTLVNAFSATGPGPQTAPYPCSLTSMDNLYLRCNLMGSAFQSVGHERFLPNGNMVIESQIWARIPIEKQGTTDPIVYQDTGAEMFVLNPQQRSLDSVELFLTDEFGRSLSEVSSGQVADGMLNFTCTIRWDIMTPKNKVPGFKPTSQNMALGTNHIPGP